MDFTLKTYKQLLATLLNQDYSFFTFQEYIENNSSLITGNSSLVILRHDVDRLPDNALRVAELEKRLGVRGSYYFRVVKQSFDAGIIREIAAMGHEIGYHYENLSAVVRRKDFRKPEARNSKHEKKDEGWKLKAELGEQELGVRSQEVVDSEQKLGDSRQEEEVKSKKAKGKTEKLTGSSLITHHSSLFTHAIEDFEENLKKLRKICPIKTICMHGSPMSKYDSRDLWKVYDYRDFGIIGEPYFDIDFNEVLYLTDTGRRWDGEKYNVRDKISYQPSAFSSQQTTKSEIRSTKYETNSNVQNFNYKNKKATNDNFDKSLNDSERSEQMTSLGISFHATFDIINAIKESLMPEKIMINIHPQRWTNKSFSWVKELVWQNLKNVIKKRFYISRASH